MRMELTGYRDSSRLRLVGEIGEGEFFLEPLNGTWSLAFGSIISFLSMILWPV